MKRLKIQSITKKSPRQCLWPGLESNERSYGNSYPQVVSSGDVEPLATGPSCWYLKTQYINMWIEKENRRIVSGTSKTNTKTKTKKAGTPVTSSMSRARGERAHPCGNYHRPISSAGADSLSATAPLILSRKLEQISMLNELTTNTGSCQEE